MSGPAVGVDIGGTFTDVALLADGTLTTAKVRTTADQHEGVLQGIERACEQAGVDPGSIERFRHATTVATNAMLEGAGARAALVTTAGFRDVLAIGRQDRPALYDPTVASPDPLVPAKRRFEVDERTTPDGVRSTPDELDGLAFELADPALGVESVAVCFLHAYEHPGTEQVVADRLRDDLSVPVVASHEVLPEFREYERTSTTVAAALLRPVVERYLSALVAEARERGLPAPRVMQSNGGIADPATVRSRAETTLLSGPAAGVVGAALFEPPTHDGVITVDIGGTSCDVGLVTGGDVERTTDGSVGGHPVHLPMVDVETVGAGGGSIAWVDEGGALRVGPRSAGSHPGPACYDRGGEHPTVTDAAVELGYLGADATLGRDLSIAADAATDALRALAVSAGLDDAVAAARGVRRVTNAHTTRAIRRVTLERGTDPRGFALVAFGGAGPMHAAAVATNLDIGTVVVPRANGVLSALGLLAADERHDTSRTFRAPLADIEASAVETVFDDLTTAVEDSVSQPAAATVTREADLRYSGQDHELTVTVPPGFDPDTVADRFHETHERRRDYRLPGESIDLVTLRVSARVSGGSPSITHEGSRERPVTHRSAWFDGRFRETPVYDRETLPVGMAVDGPAIAEGDQSTVVVPPDWRASVDERGTLVLEVTS